MIDTQLIVVDNKEIDYYERPELSRSDLLLIDKSIDHYLLKSEIEDKQAWIDGRLFHHYVLEPEVFGKTYAIQNEEIKLTTKGGKAWAKEQEDNNKIIVSHTTMQWVRKVKENYIKHPESWLLDGLIEQEYYFSHKGLKCKFKPDIINHQEKYIVDIKSIADISKAENSVIYGLAPQAYFYTLGMRMITGIEYDFYFFFGQKSTPYSVLPVKVSPSTISKGRIKIEYAVDKYKEYLDNKELGIEQFTGYSESIIEI